VRTWCLALLSASLCSCSLGQGGRSGDTQLGHGSSSTGTGDTGTEPQTSTGSETGSLTSDGTTHASNGESESGETEAPSGCGDGIVDPDEDCDDGNDIDGDGCNNDCRVSGQLIWEHFHASGVGEVDEGFDVAYAPDGTFHAVGYVRLEAAGPTHGWRRKFSAIGGMLATQTHAGPGTGNNQFRGVTIDDDGNVYVAGYENVTGEGANAWVRRHDADGSVAWTVTYNGPNSSSDVYHGITRDGAGNLLLVGYHNTPSEGHDILLRKLSPAGNVLWTRSYTGSGGGHDVGWAISATDDGHFYAVGYVTIPAEGRNMWIGKYDTDGNLLWERAYNGPDSLDDLLTGVATGPDGEAYVCGYAGANAYPWSAFVRRYNAAGLIEWTDMGPGETSEGAHCFGIARDPDARLVAVGGEIIEGTRHATVRKYTREGDVLWATNVTGGAGGPDYGRQVTIADDKEILVTGSIDRGLDARDIWIARFTP
jgi:cysteine-rich repeat protein